MNEASPVAQPERVISHNPVNPPINPLEKKLQLVYSHASGISDAYLNNAKEILDNFLQGQTIDLKFTFGPESKRNDLILRGLMTIYANASDFKTKLRAKDTVKKYFNPLSNPILASKIIETYNNSKFNEFPIKQIDKTVSWALLKGLELNFGTIWDLWIRRNVGPQNSYIAPGIIALMYSVLTGMQGTRNATWFAQYYNDYKKNPDRFTPQKAQDPSKIKLDRSNHTVSDIIKYIYNPGGTFNPKIADAFSKANTEILSALKNSIKNPLSWKVFEYVVMNKLDSEEIVGADKKHFPNIAKVTGAFRDLAVMNKKASKFIDFIYKKHKLALPPFSTWKTSDLNKAPSDRGELAPEKLNELRMMVRRILMEHVRNNN